MTTATLSTEKTLTELAGGALGLSHDVLKRAEGLRPLNERERDLVDLVEDRGRLAWAFGNYLSWVEGNQTRGDRLALVQVGYNIDREDKHTQCVITAGDYLFLGSTKRLTYATQYDPHDPDRAKDIAFCRALENMPIRISGE